MNEKETAREQIIESVELLSFDGYIVQQEDKNILFMKLKVD